eukprot:Clim_evm58s144 gene=Clim_evmTU58s144
MSTHKSEYDDPLKAIALTTTPAGEKLAAQRLWHTVVAQLELSARGGDGASVKPGELLESIQRSAASPNGSPTTAAREHIQRLMKEPLPAKEILLKQAICLHVMGLISDVPSVALVPSIKLTGNQYSLRERRIGYLGAGLLIPQGPEDLKYLVINSILQDLNYSAIAFSSDQRSQASSSLSNGTSEPAVISPTKQQDDLIESRLLLGLIGSMRIDVSAVVSQILPVIGKLIDHPRPAVRARAVYVTGKLTLMEIESAVVEATRTGSFASIDDKLAESTWTIRSRLNDPNWNVRASVIAAMRHLMRFMAAQNISPSQRLGNIFRELLDQLCQLSVDLSEGNATGMRDVGSGSESPSGDQASRRGHKGLTRPFLHSNLLALIADIVQVFRVTDEDMSSEKLASTLMTSLRRIPKTSIMAYMIISEAVLLYSAAHQSLKEVEGLTGAVKEAIRSFLSSPSRNLRWKGLKLMNSVPLDIISSFRMEVVDCLDGEADEEADPLINSAALEVLFRIANKDNAQAILKVMLGTLERQMRDVSKNINGKRSPSTYTVADAEQTFNLCWKVAETYLTELQSLMQAVWELCEYCGGSLRHADWQTLECIGVQDADFQRVLKTIADLCVSAPPGLSDQFIIAIQEMIENQSGTNNKFRFLILVWYTCHAAKPQDKPVSLLTALLNKRSAPFSPFELIILLSAIYTVLQRTLQSEAGDDEGVKKLYQSCLGKINTVRPNQRQGLLVNLEVAFSVTGIQFTPLKSSIAVPPMVNSAHSAGAVDALTEEGLIDFLTRESELHRPSVANISPTDIRLEHHIPDNVSESSVSTQEALNTSQASDTNPPSNVTGVAHFFDEGGSLVESHLLNLQTSKQRLASQASTVEAHIDVSLAQSQPGRQAAAAHLPRNRSPLSSNVQSRDEDHMREQEKQKRQQQEVAERAERERQQLALEQQKLREKQERKRNLARELFAGLKEEEEEENQEPAKLDVSSSNSSSRQGSISRTRDAFDALQLSPKVASSGTEPVSLVPVKSKASVGLTMSAGEDTGLLGELSSMGGAMSPRRRGSGSSLLRSQSPGRLSGSSGGLDVHVPPSSMTGNEGSGVYSAVFSLDSSQSKPTQLSEFPSLSLVRIWREHDLVLKFSCAKDGRVKGRDPLKGKRLVLGLKASGVISGQPSMIIITKLERSPDEDNFDPTRESSAVAHLRPGTDQSSACFSIAWNERSNIEPSDDTDDILPRLTLEVTVLDPTDGTSTVTNVPCTLHFADFLRPMPQVFEHDFAQQWRILKGRESMILRKNWTLERLDHAFVRRPLFHRVFLQVAMHRSGYAAASVGNAAGRVYVRAQESDYDQNVIEIEIRASSQDFAGSVKRTLEDLCN